MGVPSLYRSSSLLRARPPRLVHSVIPTFFFRIQWLSSTNYYIVYTPSFESCAWVRACLPRPYPGKSTLLDLLQRFYDPQSGSIEIGGVPLPELALAELRGLLGFVPQDPVLFAGTLKENLR